MKVLLVDDHILFREGLASLLIGQPNFEVVGGASNIREAVEQTQKLEPDLILMDFSLPDGTGLEATQKILGEYPETQIVFLTVHEDDEHLFAAIRGGAVGYLPKSVPVKELLAYLRRVERGEPAITPGLTGRILKRFAQSKPRPSVRSTAAANLTEREMEVLREIADRATNKEISQRLVISERTVKNHVSRILAKLNVKSRHEAAEFARKSRLFGDL